MYKFLNKSGAIALEENNQDFSFVQTEHKILEFWSQNNVFKKSLEKTKSGEPISFTMDPHSRQAFSSWTSRWQLFKGYRPKILHNER